MGTVVLPKSRLCTEAVVKVPSLGPSSGTFSFSFPFFFFSLFVDVHFTLIFKLSTQIKTNAQNENTSYFLRGREVEAGIASVLSETSLSVPRSNQDSSNFQRPWTMRASEGGGGGKELTESAKNVIGGGGRELHWWLEGSRVCALYSESRTQGQPPACGRRELESPGETGAPWRRLPRRLRPTHSQVLRMLCSHTHSCVSLEVSRGPRQQCGL